MSDLDTQTLLGETLAEGVVPWPHGYGNRPQRVERTLFGETSLWRTTPWPEGYGST